MPISSFRLKSTLGRNYKTDFDDTLRAKEALRDLEYYEEPSYGMTGYPDEALFSAIEEFQKDNGLRRDGVMKPGGETENALSGVLVAANDANNELSNDTGEYQLAQMPIEAPPLGGGIGPAIGGAAAGGVIGYELLRQQQKNRDRQNMGIVDPFPILPPANDPPPKFDNKTEFPADAPEIPTNEGIPVEPVPNDPVIFQALSDELRRELQQPLESHRGNLLTQRNLRRWIDIGLETFELWKPRVGESFEHTGGSYGSDGSYQKEDYLKNIETGGRKGSSNADATFKYRFADETQRKLYMNSGRMRKDHQTGVAWEEGSINRLVRNAGEDAAELVEKLVPGMDEAEWEERARKKWIEIHTRMMGRPPSK